MGKNIFTPNQLRLLESISENKRITSKFFFTGGTALSHFYLRHRFSEDLDFFSEDELEPLVIKSWIKEVSKKLSVVKTVQNTLSGQEIFYFHFPQEDVVKVDFAYFPFPHLGTFTRFNDLKVSSLEDIAVNKVQAIITRKRARDYLDLYLATQKLGWTIKDLQKNYRLKFEVWLGPEELATNFINVLDAKDKPIFLGNISQKEVTDFFLSEAQKLKEEILKI